MVVKFKSDMVHNTDSTLMTVITVGCYVLFVITLQSVAAVATIIAALSTALLNFYKYRLERKNNKKQRRQDE